MPNTVPISLGSAVVTRTYSWMAIVIEAWGDEWGKWEVVYNFDGNSQKLSTDYTNKGIYNGGAH